MQKLLITLILTLAIIACKKNDNTPPKGQTSQSSTTNTPVYIPSTTVPVTTSIITIPSTYLISDSSCYLNIVASSTAYSTGAPYNKTTSFKYDSIFYQQVSNNPYISIIGWSDTVKFAVTIDCSYNYDTTGTFVLGSLGLVFSQDDITNYSTKAILYGNETGTLTISSNNKKYITGSFAIILDDINTTTSNNQNINVKGTFRVKTNN